MPFLAGSSSLASYSAPTMCTVVSLLLHYCCTAVTLFPYCVYTVVTRLVHTQGGARDGDVCRRKDDRGRKQCSEFVGYV
jgi:hypothetical protein